MKCPLKVPAVRYATQPPTTTATSCLSSRRAATNNETKATATPTQSSTTGQNAHSLEKSPVARRPPRKHVQFPDTASESPKEKTGKRVTVQTRVVQLRVAPVTMVTPPPLAPGLPRATNEGSGINAIAALQYCAAGCAVRVWAECIGRSRSLTIRTTLDYPITL